MDRKTLKEAKSVEKDACVRVIGGCGVYRVVIKRGGLPH